MGTISGWLELKIIDCCGCSCCFDCICLCVFSVPFRAPTLILSSVGALPLRSVGAPVVDCAFSWASGLGGAGSPWAAAGVELWPAAVTTRALAARSACWAPSGRGGLRMGPAADFGLLLDSRLEARRPRRCPEVEVSPRCMEQS